MTAVANDKLALAIQRMERIQIWFDALSTKSKTEAEVRARLEDAEAISTVLECLSQAERLITRIAEDATWDGPSSARLFLSTGRAP